MSRTNVSDNRGEFMNDHRNLHQTPAATDDPLVTLVVVPRERFTAARESLESIYAHTTEPFRLVYVDGGSPPYLRDYVAQQAQQRGFDLIRTEHYLSPNHARNLGLRRVTTKHVVFVDNDVIVTPGWLQALVDCAEATGAAIVGPLTCQGIPVHEIIHCAGGFVKVTEEVVDGVTIRRLTDGLYLQGRRIRDVRSELRRQATGLAEFHCVLVRTDFLHDIGLLDEQLLNTREHVDLCLTAAARGESVYFEPAALVTYTSAARMAWSDLPYYALRWSDAWERASLARLQTKWNLAADIYFSKKLARVGWRRQVMIARPLVARLRLPRGRTRAEGIVMHIERVLNRYLTARY